MKEIFYVIKITAQKGQKCEKCNGTGKAPVSEFVLSDITYSCMYCDGKGVSLPVDVPIDEAIKFLQTNGTKLTENI